MGYIHHQSPPSPPAAHQRGFPQLGPDPVSYPGPPPRRVQKADVANSARTAMLVLALIASILAVLFSLFAAIVVDTNTSEAEFDGTALFVMPIMFSALALGIIGVLVWLSRRTAARLDLATNGQVAVATVSWSKKDSYSRAAKQITGYTFVVDGTSFDGVRSERLPTFSSGRPTPEGTRLWVLYDPSDPSRKMCWPP